MDIRSLAPGLSVTGQLHPDDVVTLKNAGYRAIICNRPDGEGSDQALFADIERAAQQHGMQAHYLPADTSKVSDEQAELFGKLLETLPKPIVAYCRSGMRSTTLWALSQARAQPLEQIVDAAKKAGFDMASVARRIANQGQTPMDVAQAMHTVVIVGGGIFEAAQTAHSMGATMPRGVHWIKSAVAAFEPERNAVILNGCRVVRYQQLIVCPGLKLDWHAIEGLADTLGRNGVTSNYLYHLAPYTWELVQQLRGGRAIFTQPPMPIKCAGAPQKAMYLSADHWRRSGVLGDTQIEFYSAGAVLFGVADYVPALMAYVEAYRIDLNFGHTLTRVDGAARTATFTRVEADGSTGSVTRPFDMLHVVPPQVSPDFVRASPLSDAAGWIDVDPATLRHKSWENIHALGDATNTSNAKTAAAARKQAPVVAHNVLAALGLSLIHI